MLSSGLTRGPAEISAEMDNGPRSKSEGSAVFWAETGFHRESRLVARPKIVTFALDPKALCSWRRRKRPRVKPEGDDWGSFESR